MLDITINEILAALINMREGTNIKEITDNKEPLYIKLSSDYEYSKKQLSFTTPELIEVVLDFNDEGKLIGIEFC